MNWIELHFPLVAREQFGCRSLLLPGITIISRVLLLNATARKKRGGGAGVGEEEVEEEEEREEEGGERRRTYRRVYSLNDRCAKMWKWLLISPLTDQYMSPLSATRIWIRPDSVPVSCGVFHWGGGGGGGLFFSRCFCAVFRCPPREWHRPGAFVFYWLLALGIHWASLESYKHLLNCYQLFGACWANCTAPLAPFSAAPWISVIIIIIVIVIILISHDRWIILRFCGIFLDSGRLNCVLKFFRLASRVALPRCHSAFTTDFTLCQIWLNLTWNRIGWNNRGTIVHRRCFLSFLLLFKKKKGKKSSLLFHLSPEEEEAEEVEE